MTTLGTGDAGGMDDGRVDEEQTMSGFKRIIKMRPAYDRRHTDPARNYGIHGVEIGFYLKGPLGTMQFILYTNWNLPNVQAEIDRRPADGQFPYLMHKPQPADIGYHSPVPMYEGDKPNRDNCCWTGGVCYYDGSSLMAEDVFQALLTGGLDGLWRELEERYQGTFAEGDQP